MATGVLAGVPVFVVWSFVLSDEYLGVPFYLSFVPYYVLGGFVAGFLTWRYLPSSVPYFGVVAGTLTNALNYIVGSVLAAFIEVLIGCHIPYRYCIPSGEMTFQEILVEGFTTSLTYAQLGVALTFWISIPLSLFFGHLHEQSRTR